MVSKSQPKRRGSKPLSNSRVFKQAKHSIQTGANSVTPNIQKNTYMQNNQLWGKQGQGAQMPYSFKNQMMQESIGPLPVDSSCIEQMDEMDTSNHTIANITQQLN